MITKSEYLEFMIKEKEEKSKALKEKHEWGDWDNWRVFTSIDIEINELKIKLIELENESLRESYKTYKNCLNE